MVNKRMAFIVVWFGDFPSYLNLFLQSASKQRDFDFIFFIENDKLPYSSDNIKFIKISFDEFNALAISRGIIESPITYAYKLCDIKPAWFHILEDYLPESKYDYIGYIDVDLVLGKINDFFSPTEIRTFDLCTITTEYISGAFTIMRNNSQMRTLYRKARGWQYIFNSNHHFAFDEKLRFSGLSEQELCLISSKYGPLQSYSDVVFESYRNKEINIKADKYIAYESLPKLIKYENGIVKDTETGTNYIMFHFVGAKQNIFWTYPDWNLLPDSFFINRYGFYHLQPRHMISNILNKKERRQVISKFKKKLRTVIRLITTFDIQKIFIVVAKKYND